MYNFWQSIFGNNSFLAKKRLTQRKETISFLKHIFTRSEKHHINTEFYKVHAELFTVCPVVWCMFIGDTSNT